MNAIGSNACLLMNRKQTYKDAYFYLLGISYKGVRKEKNQSQQ